MTIYSIYQRLRTSLNKQYGLYDIQFCAKYVTLFNDDNINCCPVDDDNDDSIVKLLFGILTENTDGG